MTIDDAVKLSDPPVASADMKFPLASHALR